MKVAFIFPGQGSQVVGMGRELHEAFPRAREVFAAADEAYGGGLSRLCFNGPEEDLRRTENTQPAIIATSVAALRVLEDRGVRPELVAGHSVGEYAALVAAGVLDERAAVTLTRMRGRLMESSCPEGTGGMAALTGLDRAAVEELCAQVSSFGVVQIAAMNTPGQVVIAGHVRALTSLIALAKSRDGANATMLPVSGPFHSALMKSAEDGLKEALEKARFAPAQVGVVANVDAEPHSAPAQLQTLLIGQLTRPVLWQASVERMIKLGVTVFVELGAGRILSGLIRRIDNRVQCLSVRDPQSLEKTVDHFKANGYAFAPES